MRVRCEIDLDTATGNYNVKFHNLEQPGGELDLARIKLALSRVLTDWQAQTASDKQP